jgi:hypothetical protein
MPAIPLIRSVVSEGAGLNAKATRYAIEELARRAGVHEEEFLGWRIDHSEHGFINVFVQPGTSKRIRFPRVSLGTWNRIRTGSFRTSSASWPAGSQPEFGLPLALQIPFSSVDRADLGPLFVWGSPDRFTCAADLPLSVVLTLSRFEETLPSPRDAHGRFEASSSVAFRDGFLHRPIVDEYGLAFERVLRVLLPAWHPPERCLRVNLSHDVDEIGIPFSLRSAVANGVKLRRPLSTVRDLISPVFGVDTTGQSYLKRLVQDSLDRQLSSAVYWKTSKRNQHDTGYNLEDRRVRSHARLLQQHGVELGIHPSYETFQSPELFRSEVTRLQEFLGTQRVGGRQHYLRWSPESWIHWNAAGLAYDSSVGFADHIGFRAGTCIPYRPWLFSQQRRADLIEIPLIAMDSALRGYMAASPHVALTMMRELVGRCRIVGGVFTLSWHNTTLMNSEYNTIYLALLDEIAHSPSYDWRTTSA